MKKLLLFLSIILSSTVCFGQNRKYDKIIEEFDVRIYVKRFSPEQPDKFWEAVGYYNKGLAKLRADADKKSQPMLNSRHAMYEAKLSAEQAKASYLYISSKEITDTLLIKSGIRKTFPDVTLDVIMDTYPNAWTCPVSSIFMTNALLEAVNYDYTALMGIVAHEATHFFLQHLWAAEYATQKKIQSNSVAAAVVAGVNAMANAYAQANGAADESSWENVNRTTEELAKAAKEDALYRFMPKYGRNQEFEADIIAVRFLEWIGLDPMVYLTTLNTIAAEDDRYYDSSSDHPKTAERVDLLKYMLEKYPMRQ